MNFETLVISEADGVAHIQLNRPEKANAMNGVMWKEIRAAFDWLSTSRARVGVLSAQGKHFTAGIDIELLMAVRSEITALPEGVRQERLRELIGDLQDAISAAESCRKPVIAAIHGACVGAGVDLVTACDMRYSTQDARFSVKEVDLAIVADVGTLQRLPRLIGEGLARELAYTGREFDGKEAHAMRLVNQVFPDQDSLMKSVMELATWQKVWSMSRPRMRPYCSLMISRKQFQQASNGVQPVSKTEPDLKLNDRQTNWEDYML